MSLTAQHGDRVQIASSQPLRGVAVVRFAFDGHLSRTVPERFSTVLHLAGRSEWSMGSTRWLSGPGTIGVKIPGEVYAERKRQGRSQFQVVLFDQALVEEARQALDRPHVAPEDYARDRDDPRVRPLHLLHRRLLAGDVTPAALEHDVCAALAALVELTHAPRRSERAGASTWRTAVARARALLDERLTEMVTLDELAAHARLDKFRLCRAFRDEVGLPPHAYVTHRRISRAQELLALGVAQADVAVRVGLYDQSQLHRHFKRIIGVTPGAFARSVVATGNRTRTPR